MSLLPVATFVALVATGCGVVSQDRGGVRVDTAELRVVEARLQPALQDFRALPPPDDFRPSQAAQILGCARDDFGYGVQPLAVVGWDSTAPPAAGADMSAPVGASQRGEHAADAVAAALTARGWTSKARQAGIHGIVVEKRESGYTIQGRVAAYTSGPDNAAEISVSAWVDAPEPCSGT